MTVETCRSHCLRRFFRGQGAGMSNRLSMAQTQAIQALAATGQSNRAISRALGVDRGTVAKTLSQIQNQPPVWEAPTGSDDAPAGFQDAHQVVQSGLTPVAESDVKTCSASITANSSSTTVSVATPAGSSPFVSSCLCGAQWNHKDTKLSAEH